ncbi:MAG: metallophosphoesterase family protein [Armatimonadota bacterium]
MRMALILLLIMLFIAGCGGGSNSTIPSANQFKFAVMGDNRPVSNSGLQPAVFTKVLESIKSSNAKFAVNAGDCIGSSSDEDVSALYDAYSDMIQSLYGAKVYLAVGNHDIEESSRRQSFFKDKLGALYYSFDFLNSHFIVLDSEIIDQQAKIIGDQLTWLKDDLRTSSDAAHVFVFIHRPLYPADGHIGRCMDMYPAERDALHKLFVDNKVDIVFSGHEHIFYDKNKDGVRYIITGGAGSPLYESVDGTGMFHHYVLIHVNGDKLDLEVIRIDK